jgi:hypothetical protein
MVPSFAKALQTSLLPLFTEILLSSFDLHGKRLGPEIWQKVQIFLLFNFFLLPARESSITHGSSC